MPSKPTEHLIEQLFPFYLMLEGNGKIVRMGRSIQKLCKQVQVNDLFFDHFVISGAESNQAPCDFSALEHQLIIVKIRESDFQMKGQIVALETDRGTNFVVAVTPFFTNMSALSSTGLHFGDFAPYDPIFDFLLILQSEKRANKASDEAKKQLTLEKKLATLLYKISSTDESFDTWQVEFTSILKEVCTELELQVGHVLVRSQSHADTLESAQIWFITDHEKFSEIRRVSTSMQFPLDVGIPGAVAASKKTQWVNDIQASDNFPRCKQSSQLNLKTGIGIPVFAHGKIFAVVEFFADRIIKSDPTLILFFDTLGRHLSSIIELNHAQQLSQKHERDISEQNIQLSRLNSNLEEEIRVRRIAERSLLEEKENAERANLAKSDFLANMSHEIRTPLNGVVGMTYLMEQTTLDSEQNKFLENIKVSCSHLLSLINDILDFSKVESGELNLENSPFSIFHIARDLQMMFRESSENKGLNLSILCDPSLPKVLMGDPVRCKQIFVNLLSNAIKFTQFGEVRLTIESDPISDTSCQLKCRISDTGTGIPPCAYDKMFKVFSQADSSTTRRFGGTGLGLAITKQLVDAMAGTIRFESEVNKGTTFFVDIVFEISDESLVPVNAPQHSESLLSLTPPQQGQGAKILVAEDNETNQIVIRTILKNWGYQVKIAGNGQEAVECARHETFDLIFMDCQMPVMSGFDATGEIRKMMEGKPRTPIIAMTANAIRGDRERCIAAGMDDYTTKPLHIDALKHILHQYIKTKESSHEEPIAQPPQVETVEDVDFDFGSLDQQAAALVEMSAISLLKSLHTPEGVSLFDAQVPTFLQSAPPTLQKFRELLAAKNIATLKQEVHKFKSSCGVIGAMQMFEFCDAIEHLPEANIDAFDGKMQELESCFFETALFLKNLQKEAA